MPVDPRTIDEILGGGPLEGVVKEILGGVNPHELGPALARSAGGRVIFEDPQTGESREAIHKGKIEQAIETFAGSASLGLTDQILKPQDDTIVTEEPTTGLIEGAMVHVLPELAGFAVGAPQKIVGAAGKQILKRALPAGLEAIKAVEAGNRGYRTLATAVAAQTAAEGAGGLAYGAAEGLVRGLSGEELRDHVAKTGLAFGAFGAAAVPVGIGLRLLAKRLGKTHGEVAADLANEAKQTGEPPDVILKRKVEANVSTLDFYREQIQTLSPEEKVQRLQTLLQEGPLGTELRTGVPIPERRLRRQAIAELDALQGSLGVTHVDTSKVPLARVAAAPVPKGKGKTAAEYGELAEAAILGAEGGAGKAVGTGISPGVGLRAAEPKAGATAGAKLRAEGTPPPPGTDPMAFGLRPKPLGKETRLQYLRDTHLPPETSDMELVRAHRARVENQDWASLPPAPVETPSSAPVTMTPNAEASLPALAHAIAPEPVLDLPTPELPLRFSMTNTEKQALLGATGKAIPQEVPRSTVMRNLSKLSRESLDSLQGAITNDLAASESSLKSVRRDLRAGKIKAGSSQDERQSLLTLVNRLKSEQKAVEAALEDAQPLLANELVSEEVLSGKQPTIRQPEFGGPVKVGVPLANARDFTGAPLEPGADYKVSFRTGDGIRETLLSGEQIGEALSKGRLGKLPILEFTEILPTRGTKLYGGVAPLDPEAFRDLVARPVVSSTKDFLTRAGVLTKEGEEYVKNLPSDESAFRMISRIFTTPQYFFRKHGKLAQFAHDAMTTEIQDAAWKFELVERRWKGMLQSLKEAERKEGGSRYRDQLFDVIFTSDVAAQEARAMGLTFESPSVAELTKRGVPESVAKAYKEFRKTTDLAYRLEAQHARWMVRHHRKRLAQIDRALAKKVTPVERATLEGERAYLEDRVSQATPGYLEDYFRHQFIGGWRLSVDGMTAPKFYRSVGEALKAGRQMTKDAPGTPIKVFPKLKDSLAQKGVIVDRADYWQHVKNLEEGLGLTEREAAELMEGDFRLRSRKRRVGYLLHRKGAPEYSNDVESVMEDYFASVPSHILAEKLKARGTALLEELPEGTTRQAFERYLSDVLRQKQPWEKGSDRFLAEVMQSVPGRIVHEALMAGEKVPVLGTLAKAGARTMESDFPSRRLVNGALSTTAHLRLGLGNVGSALVNLAQVPINVYPILGEKYTALGYAKYLSEFNKPATRRLLERAGIQVLTPKYETGMFLNRSKFERMSLGLFNGAERMNKAVTFLGKYHQMLDGGHSVGEAFRGARDLVARTQFVYGPSTSPEIMRSLFAKVPLQFKGFLARELGLTVLGGDSFLGQAAKGHPAQFVRFLGATTLLAGVLGLPAAKQLGNLMEWFTGRDPLEAMKLKFIQQGQTLLEEDKSMGGVLTSIAAKGLPAALGADFSERIGFGDFIPTRWTNLLGPALGAAWDSVEAYRETKDAWSAVGMLGGVPSGTIQMLRAMDEDGTLRSPATGRITARGLSPSELFMRSVGVPVAKTIRQRDITSLAREKEDRETQGFSRRVRQWARATRVGSYDEADAILEDLLDLAEREGIDMDRVRAGMKRAMEDLELSPTERIFTKGRRSVRQHLGGEALEE